MPKSTVKIGVPAAAEPFFAPLQQVVDLLDAFTHDLRRLGIAHVFKIHQV